MIRVERIYTCTHDIRPAKPIVVKSQGHTYPDETRYCLCTGEAVKMNCTVKHSDPESGKPH